MLDSKSLRADPETMAANLARRGFKLDVESFRSFEERRKAVQVEADRLRAEYASKTGASNPGTRRL